MTSKARGLLSGFSPRGLGLADSFRMFLRSFLLLIFASTVLLLGASETRAQICFRAQRQAGLLAFQKDLQSLSLTYAPSIQTQQGGQQSFPNHVLFEAFHSGERKPWTQQLVPYFNPSTGLLLPFAKDFFHEQGLGVFYRRFERNFGAELKQSVSKAEARLSLDRLAVVTVTNKKLKRRRGFIRIFNGSRYSSGVRAETRYRLPLELEMAASNKKTSAVDFFRDQGMDVFEIGKFVLDQPTPEELRLRPELAFSTQEAAAVRRDLFLWMINYLEVFNPQELKNSYYFAHVSSVELMKHYRRTFHLQVIDRGLSQGLAEHENLMGISGDRLLSRLKELVQGIETELKKETPSAKPEHASSAGF